MASNLIGICLRALEKDDLSAPDLRAGAVFYRFDGLELSEQEKRGGVVGPRDVDPGTKILSLHFPRLQLFYMRGSEEVELAMDEPIDTQSEDNPFGKGTGVQIYFKRVTRSRQYSLGEPVIITQPDFNEIAMACHLFAADLAAKLPKLPPPKHLPQSSQR